MDICANWEMTGKLKNFQKREPKEKIEKADRENRGTRA